MSEYRVEKFMSFELTCYCCGSSEFQVKPLLLTNIEGQTYLYNSDIDGQQVICNRCGLEDYVANLVIKVFTEERLAK